MVGLIFVEGSSSSGSHGGSGVSKSGSKLFCIIETSSGVVGVGGVDDGVGSVVETVGGGGMKKMRVGRHIGIHVVGWGHIRAHHVHIDVVHVEVEIIQSIRVRRAHHGLT